MLLAVVCAWTSVSDAKRRELTPEDYLMWNDLAAPVLSDDGQWVAYTLSNASGAQELVIRSTKNAAEFRVPRGTLPKGLESEDGLTEDGKIWLELAVRPAQFSADSRYLVFAIAPPAADIRQRSGFDLNSPEVLHRLGLLRLPEGELTTIPEVASYSMPKNSGRYLAYTLRDTADTSMGGMKMFWSEKDEGAKKEPKARILLLRNLFDGSEVQIDNIAEYVFDEKGQYLAYIVTSKQVRENGVYVRRLSDGNVMALLNGPGRYRSLELNASGKQVAFLSDRDEQAKENPRYSVYYAPSVLAAAAPVVQAGALKGLEIDVNAGVRFTDESNGLLFHVRAAAETDPHSVPLDSSDRQMQMELWHWREPYAKAIGGGVKEGAPSYLSVYYIEERRWVQLSSASSPQVLLSDDANLAVGIDGAPYRVQKEWGELAFDIYLINTRSGVVKSFRRGVKAGSPFFSLSPSGRHLMYFENRRWWSLDIEKEKLVDLTGALLPDVSFDYDENFPVALPIAGWTAADRHILLYDRHDIWEVDPTGLTPARNLTDGMGRRENIVFRLWENAYGREVESAIDESASLLLLAIDERTMRSGIWQTRVGSSRSPEKLLMLDKRITPIARAKGAHQYLLTMETFSEYPDLWTGSRFDRLKKISNANPQQQEYRWGNVELVHFTSSFGVPLKGRLYKPEGFDPSKKYPLIVNLYEISGGKLHQYVSPVPLSAAPSAEAWPIAISSGYLMFIPDVQMSAPYPHQGTVAAAVPAVRALLNRGFVDPARIGLMGFSFGGFEVNEIISQTTLFRCAVSVSGISDFILLSSDRSQTYVEAGQGRHGGSIWEKPFTYMVNSPLLSADRVQTPLLLMHNELDHAAPLSQGMAFFFALQRNGKPAWLIRYPGEGHGLMAYSNRLDWDRRVREFLDHYLKDAPRPSWMQPEFNHLSQVQDRFLQRDQAALADAEAPR